LNKILLHKNNYPDTFEELMRVYKIINDGHDTTKLNIDNNALNVMQAMVSKKYNYPS
jgi:hypothetical protein